MGKSTISMAIFNSYVSHYQRVVFMEFSNFQLGHHLFSDLGISWVTAACQCPRMLSTRQAWQLLQVFGNCWGVHQVIWVIFFDEIIWNLKPGIPQEWICHQFKSVPTENQREISRILKWRYVNVPFFRPYFGRIFPYIGLNNRPYIW